MNKKLLLLPLVIIGLAALTLLNSGIAPFEMKRSITNPSSSINEFTMEVKKNTGQLSSEITLHNGTISYQLIRPDGSYEKKETLEPGQTYSILDDISYINGKWTLKLDLDEAIVDYLIQFNK